MRPYAGGVRAWRGLLGPFLAASCIVRWRLAMGLVCVQKTPFGEGSTVHQPDLPPALPAQAQQEPGSRRRQCIEPHSICLVSESGAQVGWSLEHQWLGWRLWFLCVCACVCLPVCVLWLFACLTMLAYGVHVADLTVQGMCQCTPKLG